MQEINVMVERIKEIRKKSNLTYEQLSDILGSGVSTIRDWEYGCRQPRMRTLIRVSLLCNVAIDYITGINDVYTYKEPNCEPTCSININVYSIEMAKRLKLLLNSKGLDLYEFSKRIDEDPRTVTNYLYGYVFPPVNVTVKISNVLNASADYIFGLTENDFLSMVDHKEEAEITMTEQIKNAATFGSRLILARHSRGYNQKELARRTSLSQSSIASWEGGLRFPSVESLVVIAKQLNVSTDYLLGLSDNLEMK